MRAPDEKFHQRLRRLRTEHGLSIKEVASKIGVPPSSYREWEYGRAITGNAQYINIAKALNLSVYELLSGEKPNPGDLLEEIQTIRKYVDSLHAKLESFF